MGNQNYMYMYIIKKRYPNLKILIYEKLMNNQTIMQ